MMWTLKQAVAETGLSYYFLRNLCLQKKIKFIRSGTKYFVNRQSLLDFLDGGGAM